MVRLRSKPRQPVVLKADATDARLLAIELAGVVPQSQVVDVMGLGLVLEPGERPWRRVVLEVRHADGRSWRGQERGIGVLTDRRILVNLVSGPTVSYWWGSLVGFFPNVEGGYAVLDYGDGIQRLVSSPAMATIAVAGVAAIYGVVGLAEHPALASLRVAS
ncbi:hypothetical protein [Terrabacter sp. RAF57]|uniref:hypothetical protein n=1 Tax=Terrabacter sp. RAF57 TaxID=3233063 RepID=UPI003F9DE0D9